MRASWFHTLLLLILLTCAWAGPGAGARTIEFTTTEVSGADVTVSPDGQWLIFTMLGHLFRLPVTGGTAEQLTFGPYYDTDPVFSPDGTRVAFVSDRDESEGNIFVLELATGQITQVTREPWAGRPTWTPDGQAIVYLRFVREAPARRRGLVPALVRRVALNGGDPETPSALPRLFRSVFYLPDGRLAWTVVELETNSPRASTRFEVMGPQGTVSTLRTLPGYVDRAVPSPLGNGLYCSRYLPLGGIVLQPEHLLFLPFPEGAERQIVSVSGIQDSSPRFAVAADNKTLYVGDNGKIWKIALPHGSRKPLPFQARVRLEIQEPVPPPKPILGSPGSSAPPRIIWDPRLSPDGRIVVFGAAGYLWQQSLDGGPARRLFESGAFEWEPAFSPNGQQLAFVRREHGKEEVRVFDFESGQTRTLASGLNYWSPSWSPDGERLLFVEMEQDDWSNRVVAVNVGDGTKEKLTETAWWWDARPHLSGDGRVLYYSGPPGAGTLHALRLNSVSKPEPLTQLVHPFNRALVSPDGKWLAFRRRLEIWVARLSAAQIKEEDVRELSPEGGNSFAFTPDSSAVIYSSGNHVWRHPLGGGEPEQITIRLELQRPRPPPLLLQHVRVLDFGLRDFGPETSLFIEQGRIRWIGSEQPRTLPPNTVILDAGGRFVIPGLFDMHVHAAWAVAEGGLNQAAFLAYGVTSVRNMDGLLVMLNTLADRGETPAEPIPRYFFSGEILENEEPRGSLNLMLQEEQEVRTYVRSWKGWGAHFIKVRPQWPLPRVVAEEARRQGLPVVGHGMTIEQIVRSVALGYAVLEHTNLLSRPYDDVLQLLAAAGTRWDPTLGVIYGNDLLLRDEPARLVDSKLRAFTPEWCIQEAQKGGAAEGAGTKEVRGRWVEHLEAIRAAHPRGIKLQAGTDTVPTCGFFGASLHWELEYFVQAGITPLEVLRIATQQAAEAVGAQDDLGTLEPGQLADIVLLDKNPLKDIRNTQTIWRVIKGGWLFDPEKLRPPASIGPDK